jgi:hypothetical protein
MLRKEKKKKKNKQTNCRSKSSNKLRFDMKNAQICSIWCCRLLLVAKFPDFFLLVLREIKVCSPADNHIIYYAFLVFGYVNAVEYLKSKNSEMTD